MASLTLVYCDGGGCRSGPLTVAASTGVVPRVPRPRILQNKGPLAREICPSRWLRRQSEVSLFVTRRVRKARGRLPGPLVIPLYGDGSSPSETAASEIGGWRQRVARQELSHKTRPLTPDCRGGGSMHTYMSVYSRSPTQASPGSYLCRYQALLATIASPSTSLQHSSSG